MTQTAIAEITTNTDTEIIAAPAAGERISFRAIMVSPNVIGTTAALTLEDGASGNPLVSQLAVAGAMLWVFPRDAPLMLSEATALNAETTGGSAATWIVTVIYE